MIDFEWYRSFVYIYKYNSVSEAAKTRIMTQPAMSQHLALLENEIGESLFNRTTRKLTPTEKGKELYSRVSPLIESLESTSLNLKFHLNNVLPQLKIGSAIENFSELILDKISDNEIQTINYFDTADNLINLLKAGNVDIILTSKKYNEPGVEYVFLFEEIFEIVAPINLNLDIEDDAKEVQKFLNKQDWISYGLELPIIRRFWREHFKKRPTLEPIHVIPNLHLILKLISKGSGISLIPSYILKDTKYNERIKTILPKYKVKNKLYLAYETKNKNSIVINNMIENIKYLPMV